MNTGINNCNNKIKSKRYILTLWICENKVSVPVVFCSFFLYRQRGNLDECSIQPLQTPLPASACHTLYTGLTLQQTPELYLGVHYPISACILILLASSIQRSKANIGIRMKYPHSCLGAHDYCNIRLGLIFW